MDGCHLIMLQKLPGQPTISLNIHYFMITEWLCNSWSKFCVGLALFSMVGHGGGAEVSQGAFSGNRGNKTCVAICIGFANLRSTDSKWYRPNCILRVLYFNIFLMKLPSNMFSHFVAELLTHWFRSVLSCIYIVGQRDGNYPIIYKSFLF